MVAWARCERLPASKQFHHIYDDHYDKWKRHQRSIVEASAWADPAPQLDIHTRRTATVQAEDVVVQRSTHRRQPWRPVSCLFNALAAKK